MSTTKRPLVKAEKLYARICVSRVPATTARMREKLTILLSDVPTKTLINLWVAKWGHDWIDLNDLVDDSFFNDAYHRLRQEGEVEVHYLTDRAKYVCRNPK